MWVACHLSGPEHQGQAEGDYLVKPSCASVCWKPPLIWADAERQSQAERGRLESFRDRYPPPPASQPPGYFPVYHGKLAMAIHTVLCQAAFGYIKVQMAILLNLT